MKFWKWCWFIGVVLLATSVQAQTKKATFSLTPTIEAGVLLSVEVVGTAIRGSDTLTISHTIDRPDILSFGFRVQGDSVRIRPVGLGYLKDYIRDRFQDQANVRALEQRRATWKRYTKPDTTIIINKP